MRLIGLLYRHPKKRLFLHCSSHSLSTRLVRDHSCASEEATAAPSLRTTLLRHGPGLREFIASSSLGLRSAPADVTEEGADAVPYVSAEDAAGRGRKGELDEGRSLRQKGRG